jgi:hypothetical protein
LPRISHVLHLQGRDVDDSFFDVLGHGFFDLAHDLRGIFVEIHYLAPATLCVAH